MRLLIIPRHFAVCTARRVGIVQSRLSLHTRSSSEDVERRSEWREEPRKRKDKVALLVGFNGTGYQGMQMNPGVKSIEEDLFAALCKAGAVSRANSESPKKVQLIRAARTDKGVHAACNVVSLKMITEDPNIVERINAHLPAQIRVWGYIPVMRSFHARKLCSSRVYEYLLPSSVFISPSTRHVTTTPQSEDDYRMKYEGQIYYAPRTDAAQLQAMDKFRINAQTLAAFRQTLQCFEGTHNFHNYTLASDPYDASMNRFVKSINVSDPIYVDGIEWISVKLWGQSFMLHQIRKMLSMAILVVRSNTPRSIISQTFEPVKINIPKAPSLGLLLHHPVFDFYNQRRLKHRTDLPPFDLHEFQEPIEKFKRDWIYSKIFETERREREFDRYLVRVDALSKASFGYLNPQGIIPPEAIVNTIYTAQPHSED